MHNYKWRSQLAGFLSDQLLRTGMEPLTAQVKFLSLGRHEICKNKTRVLLCKRLSGQCRDVYMVVYFHLHWWWWAVVDCAVLYWAVLGWTGLWWAVVDWTAVYWAVLEGVNSYLSVYSAIFGMVTNNNNQTNNQVNLEQACSWPVRRQSVAKSVNGVLELEEVWICLGVEYNLLR